MKLTLALLMAPVDLAGELVYESPPLVLGLTQRLVSAALVITETTLRFHECSGECVLAINQNVSVQWNPGIVVDQRAILLSVSAAV